jgi:hypothetical protein
MDTAEVNEISINGIAYVRKGSSPNGNRAVVVVDRGWIFAGDVTEDDGKIILNRAVWLFRWESIGFDGVLKNPHHGKVTIKKLDHVVEIPSDSEIFRIPVSDEWGLT